MTIMLGEQKKPATVQRKASNINNNKEGSVRKTNGKVYIDFMYLGHRVRESSGLPWTTENAKHVRNQLDKIMLAIRDNQFEFRKVFPKSKKIDFFSTLERKCLGRSRTPAEVLIKDYASEWYETLKATGRVSERTLLGYKSQMRLYIVPFFGELNFAQINPATLDEFTIWAKRQKFRKKTVSNKTINKSLIPFKMICKNAAVKYNWGAGYNPFFGYKKLPEQSSTHKIEPFSIDEQKCIIEALPDHWKPYFQFAFWTGVRQGEQIALRVGDVDLQKKQLKVRRAMTLDENGKAVIGTTKNTYSKRVIPLLTSTAELLEVQVGISESKGSKFLFCTSSGSQVHRDNLRGRVWRKALEKAKVPYRPMIQTRHTFATTALSLGENPLWIAKVMGHSTSKMVLEVYAKYVENMVANNDGNKLNQLYLLN
ncbi:Arm DNA-binding domain-containing protein [Desulfogranum marinum]|uniref:Arm DNA-binding domain-containing protein n=1 Tax=Desulfogranum marinum TaxID=453220 RepID=UPI001965FE25|nr:DUF3596 domain-containing protein [Desulfogranum marinum]MBM9514990.1 tyrosine-type recombinase/integrase [Desulfogranum marinum]